MPELILVTKRNNRKEEFKPSKITIALEKAFIATGRKFSKEELEILTNDVVKAVQSKAGEKTPHVETIQDIVENLLMQKGFFDVAKAYILYRYEHAKLREKKVEETIQKIEHDKLIVIKRSGEKEAFSVEKLKKNLLNFVSKDAEIIDINAIAEQCRSELYDGITTKEISRSLIMTVRAMIEQDPAYSRLAAKLLLCDIYKEVIGNDKIDFKRLREQHESIFIENIKKGVEHNKLDPRLLTFDLEMLAKKIDLERDNELMYLGVETLRDRYFITINDPKGRIIESPQIMWMRVAMGLAINEKNRNYYAEIFYDVLSKRQFVSSTPTLFHSGTVHPQLSSCYLNTVADDLDNIFKVYGDNAQMSKWTGGIGTDWGAIRATGAHIKKAGIKSQGVIPFLKIANDVTVAINRSGRRRGATCAYLEVWHADIEDFIELRKNTGDERRRTHDMDTASWIPDLFMKRIEENQDWTLFSPDETPDLHEVYGKEFERRYCEYEVKAKEGKLRITKTVKALDLWKKMLGMLYETGHPWITFKDPSNLRSPQDHVGVIHNSNLCTEITLNTSETETAVCNLGSINLTEHMIHGRLDEEKIKRTVAAGMRMLDNVIDINFYPTIEGKTSNMKHRPIGLGIMGFQDALYMQDINFDSDACVKFADSSMELISYYAILESSRLAKEKGTYKSYKGSKWDRNIFPVDTLAILETERGRMIDVDKAESLDWSFVREHVKKYGMRNSNCMAIAPTATISNIAGCTPTIEPIYKNIYVKSNISGDFTVINTFLVDDLKKLKLWDYEMLGKIKYNDGSIQTITEIPEKIRSKYKEVFEIDQHWLIKAAAHRAKWVDQSQSLNIYFAGTNGKEISDLYFYAWNTGLKTTYYLRTLAISQVEKSTVKTQEFGSTHTRSAKSSPVAVVQPAIAPQELKVCKVLDPGCESCQ